MQSDHTLFSTYGPELNKEKCIERHKLVFALKSKQVKEVACRLQGL